MSFLLVVALVGLVLWAYSVLDMRDLRNRFPEEQDFRALGHALMMPIGCAVWLAFIVYATVVQLGKATERKAQLRWLAAANWCLLVVSWVAGVAALTGWLG